MIRFYSIILIWWFIGTSIFAQVEKSAVLVSKDSLKYKEVNPLAPAKAAFFSAILPGLGQVYNKKYWKIPLVYGGIGTGLYYYSLNNTKYNNYRNAYKRRLEGYSDDNYQYLDNSRLIVGQRFYQRNRDISVLVTVGFYLLNIVDANIDAHLMQFNVNDKLSFRPELHENEINYKQNLGLTLNYHF